MSKEETDFEFFQRGQQFCPILSANDNDFRDWRADLPDLAFGLDCVYPTAASVIARSTQRSLLNITAQDKKLSAVQAVMIQNVPVLEYSIRSGRYVAAASLDRQAMEGMESPRGLISDKQKDGETPKLRAFMNLGFGKTYGVLSGLAHLSQPKLISFIAGGSPHALDPIYNQQLVKHLVPAHFLSLSGCIQSISALISCYETDGLTKHEHSHLVLGMSSLIKEGILVEKGIQAR